MKRIILILIALSAAFSAIAQETKSQIKTRVDVIRNETVAGANTKTRMANAYQEIADGMISIYPVSASGTDDYTATLQGLDAYSGRIIFVVFANNNTGAVTLDIGSIGVEDVQKDDDGSWVALEADDIVAGKLYKLYHDGTRFQIDLGGGGAGLVTQTLEEDVTISTDGAFSFSILNSAANTGINVSESAVVIAAGTAGTVIQGDAATGAMVIDDGRGTPRGLEESSDFSATYSALSHTNKTYVDATAAAAAAAKVADAINNGTTTVAPSQNAVFDEFAKRLLDRATPSTAGGTITLDMNSQVQRMHVGSASFSTPKTIALSNTTNSLVFSFSFTVTNVAAVLTMPSDFVMSTVDWNGTDWTPPATGNYEMGGSFDGTNWIVKIAGPFN